MSSTTHQGQVNCHWSTERQSNERYLQFTNRPPGLSGSEIQFLSDGAVGTACKFIVRTPVSGESIVRPTHTIACLHITRCTASSAPDGCVTMARHGRGQHVNAMVGQHLG